MLLNNLNNKKEVPKDIYSLLYGENQGASVSKNEKNFQTAVVFGEYYSPTNDVFHIGKNKFSFSDIVLPKEIEEEIQNIVFEHKDEQFMREMWLLPTNKILFYGSPGCGKTMLTYVLAQALKKELKVINLGKLVSSHLGETSNNLASIFSRYGNKDTVLFIDEFDIIGRLRWDTGNDHNEMKRIVNTLLQLIDFFPSEGFLVFATNSVEIIDEALLRRMDRVIEIPLPNLSSIKKFLKIKLTRYSKISKNIDYAKLAKTYLGASFSEIQRSLQKKIKNKVINSRKKGADISFSIEDLKRN